MDQQERQLSGMINIAAFPEIRSMEDLQLLQTLQATLNFITSLVDIHTQPELRFCPAKGVVGASRPSQMPTYPFRSVHNSNTADKSRPRTSFSFVRLMVSTSVHSC